MHLDDLTMTTTDLILNERFGDTSIGPLPLRYELECFFSLMEPPSSSRRTSPVQGKYCQSIPACFGGADLVIQVDRAIMSCTRWWIQHFSTSNFQENNVITVLNALFAAVNYNEQNLDGSRPLIPVNYLKAFMKLPSTDNGRKCTMQNRYFKLFQLAVKNQYKAVFCLFKFASPSLVHHSLHQYTMKDSDLIRDHAFCPFTHCPYCIGPHPGVQSIFGLRRRFDDGIYSYKLILTLLLLHVHVGLRGHLIAAYKTPEEM